MYNKEHWFEQITEQTLWHYTSIGVLDKLANPEGFIKATHYKSEIDTSEMFYGRKLWEKIIKKKVTPPSELLFKEMSRTDLIDRSEFIKKYLEEDSECFRILKDNIFIFCMTTLKDSQFHWENYASHPDGIAIGINVNELKKCITLFIENFKEPSKSFQVTSLSRYPIPYKMHLDYCSYGSFASLKKLLKTINLLLPYIDKTDEILQILQLASIREETVPFAKQKKYSAENEVRLTYSGPDLLNNACEINEKKMIDIFPSAQLIDTVIISPFANKDCCEQVDNIKKKYKLDFTVRLSNINKS